MFTVEAGGRQYSHFYFRGPSALVSVVARVGCQSCRGQLGVRGTCTVRLSGAQQLSTRKADKHVGVPGEPASDLDLDVRETTRVEGS